MVTYNFEELELLLELEFTEKKQIFEEIERNLVFCRQIVLNASDSATDLVVKEDIMEESDDSKDDTIDNIVDHYLANMEGTDNLVLRISYNF